MSIAKTWLRGSFAEWLIVSLIFLFTMGFISLYTYPIYYEIDAPGEMVSVQDFGIRGSVHFVTVYSGVTENLLDLYLNEFSDDPDVNITRIEPYYAKYATNLEEQNYDKEEAIEHAFDAMIEEGAPTDYASKMDEVLQRSEGYYGSSLGLMVGIGLHEELSGIDFSMGGQYLIAGTGTLESDYSVGSIGALEQKLVVAEREGVTHFFIPEDYDWYGEDSNEAEAERVAAERGLQMQIIPVETLQEAIDYLTNLSLAQGGELF